MPDPTPLLAQAERLADRFRSMPQSKLVLLAPLGLQLARQLADYARQLEGLPVLELPDAGVFAVGDQIALTAHDLAAALAAPGSGSDAGSESYAEPGSDAESYAESGPYAESESGPGVGAETVLAEAVGLVAELAQRLATTRSARM
jgi:hypothetical protein